MKNSIYKWQGEPVEVEFGYVKLKPMVDKPLFWYNYELSIDKEHKFPALRIQTKNSESPFTIANHFGIGVVKLENGGWPDRTHYSFSGGEFVETPEFAFKEFREMEYLQHEGDRDEWQKNVFPEAYSDREKLIDSRKEFMKQFR